jgi:hypothetical protein
MAVRSEWIVEVTPIEFNVTVNFAGSYALCDLSASISSRWNTWNILFVCSKSCKSSEQRTGVRFWPLLVPSSLCPAFFKLLFRWTSCTEPNHRLSHIVRFYDMLKSLQYKRDTLWAKFADISRHVSSASLSGLSAGYFLTVLVRVWGTIRIQMAKNNLSVMVAVYGTPSVMPPRKL